MRPRKRDFAFPPKTKAAVPGSMRSQTDIFCCPRLVGQEINGMGEPWPNEPASNKHLGGKLFLKKKQSLD